MAESKVSERKFVVLQGWMIRELALKGNQLIIYAIIYGFSQAENQVFTGSLQYLADWTNSTKQGVSKNLKELVEKGLIGKNERYVNGVKFCEYYATKFNGGMQQSLIPIKQSLTGGMQQSLTNNIGLDNTTNNIEDIIGYLNMRAGTQYKTSTKKTKELINARLKDGFSVEDFKIVIDKKCFEWKNTAYEQYLRPETLFGNKFEGYLNQNVNLKKSQHTIFL